MNRPTIHLLIVEDDTVDRMACRRALTQHPDFEFVISEADTGHEGLRLAQQQRPDCILLDYHLPDLDGLDFLAELADENGAIRVPVMMLTGVDTVLVAVEAMKRGARDYLVKDSERQYLELLPAVIQRVLREKRGEDKLLEAEAKYSLLVKQIPAITYTAELKDGSRTLYISPQVEALGFTREEWLSDPEMHLKRIHLDDLVRFREGLAKSRATGQPFRCEYRMMAWNGQALWYLDEASVVCNEAGRPLFLQGILVNITDSKRQEEELRQHRSWLEGLVAKRTAALTKANEQLRRDLIERKQVEEALFEEKERALVTLHSIADGVVTTDAAGLIETFNPAAEALTGCDHADAISRPIGEVLRMVGEDSRAPMENPVTSCLRDGHGSTAAVDGLLLRRDGSEIAVAISASPIHDRAGRIAGVVTVFRDMTEQRELSQRLSYQASHDALTNLMNRQELEKRLARVLAGAAEDQSEHALCFLDLDQFKVVNDTCGHMAGDQLLCQISATLQDRMRQRDTLARIGGDEFAVLLEHCPVDQALRIAHELRDTVRDLRFLWQERTFSISVSIGVALLNLATESVATALSAADNACYVAKEKGRNRVYLYQPDDLDMQERHTQMQWVASLTDALDRNRFQLTYQPIAPLQDTGQERPHYEILLRLVEGDGHLIAPNAFMPAAERYHLMPAIDRWVIRHTIQAFAARHLGKPDAELPIYAVNLSGASLNDDTLVEYIRTLLHEHSVPAQALCFEITETAAITHLVQATRLIRELKQLGCLCSLDNFGSGISSFTYLKSLPVDFLKIDGHFIRGIVESRADRAMAEAISQVAHVMAMQTVAECTENEQTLRMLKELGVDHAQGYAIMHPRPLAELDAPDASCGEAVSGLAAAGI
jgi:diguanylate cyclase (GGDEF)-like protein/PAS domain S-box-containing protein